MIQDSLKVCKQATSFKNNVTDYQTRSQKAILHTLLATSMSWLLTFIFLLYKESWQHAATALLGFIGFFTATLLLSRAFNARIIKQRYRKHYRNWYAWDCKGMEKELLGRLKDALKQRKIGSRKRALLIASIDERIGGHKKYMTKIHTLGKEVLVALSGPVLTGSAMLLLLSILIVTFWLLAITVWGAVGTFLGIEDLTNLRALMIEASYA